LKIFNNRTGLSLSPCGKELEVGAVQDRALRCLLHHPHP